MMMMMMMRTECSEVYEQYEVTSRVANGDSILERGLNIDELK